MKKRIDELVREKYIPDGPELICSDEELHFYAAPGGKCRRRLKLSASDGSILRGFAVSDSSRIVIPNPKFSARSCILEFEADTSGLKETSGDMAVIYIETSAGELEIPAYINAVSEPVRSRDAEIKSLDDFAKLAYSSPKEAYSLFTSSEFEKVLRQEDSSVMALYRGLSKTPVTYQHIEEFLVAAGKKQKIHLHLEDQSDKFYDLNAPVKDTLCICRNTWGYLRAEVTSSAGFIEPEKKTLTSDDFIGKICQLSFIINTDKMPSLKCRGRLTVSTPYETMEIGIEASKSGQMRLISPAYRNKRLLGLFREYLSLRMHRTDYRTWYELSRELVAELKEEREDSLTLLAEAYLDCCNEDFAGAIEILWGGGDRHTLSKPWEKAAYLHIAKESGLLPEEKRDIVPQLYRLYSENSDNYLILELYLMELSSQGYSAAWGLAEYENVYEKGCFSPFLYLRAWQEINSREGLLRRLSPFMIRVLLFAQKEDLLTESLLRRAAYLSGMERHFSPALFQLLSAGYEKYPGRELLEAVCKYAMKDHSGRRSYFRWYDMAVREDLHITGLYEYYLDSRPEELTDDFPLQVKLFFSYTRGAEIRRRLSLYYGIIAGKEKDPVSFDNYKDQIRAYALEELEKGSVNEKLCALYEEFFSDSDDPAVLADLSEAAFTRMVTCRSESMRRVIVVDPFLEGERAYPFEGGKAYPKVYSPSSRMLLEDGRRRRFASPLLFDIKKMLDEDRYARMAAEAGVWSTGIQLYLCREDSWQMPVGRDNILPLWKAAENPVFTRHYRDAIRERLLDYFDRNALNEETVPFLDVLKENTYGWVDKRKTFGLLVKTERYDRAFSLITRQGAEGLPDDELMLTADALCAASGGEEDEALTTFAGRLFEKGIYTRDTLEYLEKYYIASAEKLDRLYAAAREECLATVSLDRRYLIISAFAGKLTEYSERILCDYAAEEGEEKTLVRAYLVLICINMLLGDLQISDSTAELLYGYRKTFFTDGRLLGLGWLKHLSGQKETSEDHIRLADRLTGVLCEDDIKFAFMKDLDPIVIQGRGIEDRVFIEERFPSGSTAVIFYRTDGGEWKSAPMREKIKGLFGKDLVLFSGEKLEYYCEARDQDEIIKTPKKTVDAPEACDEGRSRYNILNRMVAARNAGDEEKTAEAVRAYLAQQAFMEKFFVPR